MMVMRMIGDVMRGGWRDALLGAFAWRAGYRLSCLAHQPGFLEKTQRLKPAYPAIRDGSVALVADS